MARNPRSRRDASSFADAPDMERDWTRPGPDVRRLSHDGEHSPMPNAHIRASTIDRDGDYGDYGTDDIRTMHTPSRVHQALPYLYPYSGIASEHRRGRFYGRGPKGYRRSDERIREDICDRLMTHPDIDASDIDVEVSDGIISLMGTTEDRHEKRLAELIAEDVVGVDDVDNRLKVRHGVWAAVSGERAASGRPRSRSTVHSPR